MSRITLYRLLDDIESDRNAGILCIDGEDFRIPVLSEGMFPGVDLSGRRVDVGVALGR